MKPRHIAIGIVAAFFVIHLYGKLGEDPYVGLVGERLRVRAPIPVAKGAGERVWSINRIAERSNLTVLVFMEPPADGADLDELRRAMPYDTWQSRGVLFAGIFSRPSQQAWAAVDEHGRKPTAGIACVDSPNSDNIAAGRV